MTRRDITEDSTRAGSWATLARIRYKLHRRRHFGVFLTVVVPIYNVEHWLARCLSSLADTAMAGVEFLCINDGSTDGSRQIIQEWTSRDSRFRLIDQANGGCASARNRGLAEARGDYVGFVDGDDWVDPRFFDALAANAIRTQTDIVQGAFAKHYEVDGIVRKPAERYLQSALGPTGEILDSDAFLQLQPTIWRRIYKRRFLVHRRISFHGQLRRFDDLPFQFETFLAADRISLVRGRRYNYRLQRIGQDVTANDRRLYIHFEIFEILRETLRSTGRVDAVDRLLQKSIRTHKWALELLLPEYHDEYTALSEICIQKTRMLSLEMGATTRAS